MIYLDNSATTAVDKKVLDAMLPYFSGFYGNPSSQYKLGRVAKAAVEKARSQFAKAINAEPEQIFFTSGATESNNLVRRFFGKNTVYSSVYEHPSMRAGYIVYDKESYESQKQKVCHMSDTLLSWQYVNSETGMIFPLKKIVQTAHLNNAYFHSDMTAAFGKVPIDVKDLDVDFASFSGHKFHAPKGIGVLYIKDPDKFHSDIIGGGQEKNLRSGTENVPAIVGIGEAAELFNYNPDRNGKHLNMRAEILKQLEKKMPCEYKILAGDNNVPSIISIAVKNVEGEAIMLALAAKEIFVSTGSACHSKSLEASPTVKSFNLPPEYEHGVIRISFGDDLTYPDIDYFVDELARICGILSSIRSE